MKKNGIVFLITIIIFLITADLFASGSRKRYFNRPQLGVWFGPITPMFETGETLEPALGAGAFFRYNTPIDDLKIGFETAYQSYDSSGVNSLRLIPAYMDLVYLLPINLPVRTQIKGGMGFCHVHMEPDDIKQWDPMLSTGLEISFPAGQLANIALRIDYLFIYEGHIKGSKNNGHVINAGISLYLNLNL